MSLLSNENSAPILVIGAGLSGLTAGRLLGEAGADYIILEAQDRPGGLCKTETVDGFTFDYTGHLLHLKEGESRGLIMDLIGDRLIEHTRTASVHAEGVFVDYPIQAHFGQLPVPLGDKCLEELLAVDEADIEEGLPFDSWAVKRFGPTLAGLFMIPYNEKLSAHDLGEMEISWTSWSVPVPTVEELKSIARGENPPAFGYNASFYYPARGGIDILPRGLMQGQEDRLCINTQVTKIDARRKMVTLGDGRELAYSALISTIPLPELLRISDGLPGRLTRMAGSLRNSSIIGVCLGLSGPILRPDHWIYFPEKSLPFYRMGFPTNFSDHVAPEGCGSVYAEAAWAAGDGPEPDGIAEAALESLAAFGIVDRSTEIWARIDFVMPCAYVFHDRFRATHLDSILQSLRAEDILSVGRYGAWEYSAMQDAVQWGFYAAREVLG